MLGLRVVVVALALVLAVVLLANGSVLIGGLIGAIAVVRATMLLEWWRRRRQYRGRFPGSDRGPGRDARRNRDPWPAERRR